MFDGEESESEEGVDSNWEDEVGEKVYWIKSYQLLWLELERSCLWKIFYIQLDYETICPN